MQLRVEAFGLRFLGVRGCVFQAQGLGLRVQSLEFRLDSWNSRASCTESQPPRQRRCQTGSWLVAMKGQWEVGLTIDKTVLVAPTLSMRTL